MLICSTGVHACAAVVPSLRTDRPETTIGRSTRPQTGLVAWHNRGIRLLWAIAVFLYFGEPTVNQQNSSMKVMKGRVLSRVLVVVILASAKCIETKVFMAGSYFLSSCVWSPAPA